ncbi:MAG TPA: DegT/DnrJ/EryC1/StrS family aminotransferase [Pyrinomonadaceae bacterium]|jgi:dTDP-4-amino-4,6-dideoxygalactose transaminase|nr:DegT/DnrJ/EryC1/StrS family aminotransferase [Pyrinomonadaceae bacterium]
MSVPLLDLRAQYEGLRGETLAAVGRVFESQGFVLGREVSALEEEVAVYTGARHAVGCASGSDALLLALMALDVRAGDEVVTTPYSFFATAGSIARLGARPVFVDIEPRAYNIDPAKIEAAITGRTRALMPVHLYGQCAEMGAVGDVAARRGVPVVEDAAQAIGARDGSRGAGAMGEIGCFSFYPTKNLGGAGDGGMLTTDDDSLAARLRSLRVHGETAKYHHGEIGFNSRLDALQAAVLRVKLPRLDSWSDARALHAARYRELFADAGLLEEIGLPFERGGARHIYNQFVVRVRGGRRDALVEHLRREGVGTEVYYPVPLHLQECFRYLGYGEGDFPEAERAARETLALPVYPELTEEQQRYVVDTVRNFFH